MSWPLDVGILAVEIHFPYLYVDQEELEKFDGVPGKYTLGLGQRRMGFCADTEDVCSLALTVLGNLMDRQHLAAKQIGRLDVGTESSVDKSKSVKSVLMQILAPDEAGGDVEGVDTINACFGGTQALFNALNWIESSSWDGRLAIVIMSDIAAYPPGAARCTGGAGAVALLVGPNAPLVFDRGLRAIHMRHAYDFYKPNPKSEYPIVDGKLSVDSYSIALSKCFKLYREKATAKSGTDPMLESFAGVLFHAPYCKLVQKSLARLKYSELISRMEIVVHDESVDKLRRNSNRSSNSSTDLFIDKDLEKTIVEYNKHFFDHVTSPSLFLAENVGNMYTPSLYAGLISLLITKPVSKLAGETLLLFSYGSGSCAAMFSLQISPDSSPSSPLSKLVANLSDVKQRLHSRRKASPEEFVQLLKDREDAYGKAPYAPKGSVDDLFPGSYYLTHIDEKFRRFYTKKPLAQSNSTPV